MRFLPKPNSSEYGALQYAQLYCIELFSSMHGYSTNFYSVLPGETAVNKIKFAETKMSMWTIPL